MRPPHPAWMCLVLSIIVVPAELRSRALPLRSVDHPHPPRLSWSLGAGPRQPKSPDFIILPPAADLSVPFDRVSWGDGRAAWGAPSPEKPQATRPDPNPAPPARSYDPREGGSAGRPSSGSSRGRRHVHGGGGGGGRGHGQLMRVGCVLGTCQVQNLSHRLYQLIGRSGREDSSPINPRSPHSYG